MGYTIKQKIDICLKSESSPQMTQTDLANWAQAQYNSPKPPSQTTISRILSTKNDLIASKDNEFLLVRRRKQSNPLLRQILTEWITQATWENIPVTTPIIQSTANAIYNRLPINEKDGNGIFNQKWCNHFFKRLNLNLTGTNEDIAQNCDYKLNKIWKLDEKLELKNYLAKLIHEENYAPQDIFTIDEFQLFYSLPLDQIFDVSSIDKGLKSSNSTENSLTIMLGCNIDGSEKLAPLIVGKYSKFDINDSSHEVLKNIKKQTPKPGISKQKSVPNPTLSSSKILLNKITEIYNIFYKSNSNKWITSSMFQNYLLTLEHKISGISPNRKILILLDDSSSHRIINLKFNHIKLCYLKNNASHKNPYNASFEGIKFDYLPMNFGIIEEFKILYRLQQYLEMINLQRISKTDKRDDEKDKKEYKEFENFTENFSPLDARNENSNMEVLSESDYNILFIKVIEWIKRSWDSLSQEKIYLAWKRTYLISFKTPWPASDPGIVANLLVTMAPLDLRASKYNTKKSYDKLAEIMGYLNVVIPWEIDDLLGLVNERAKITLSYVSIDEIIGSCLLDNFEQQSSDSLGELLMNEEQWYTNSNENIENIVGLDTGSGTLENGSIMNDLMKDTEMASEGLSNEIPMAPLPLPRQPSLTQNLATGSPKFSRSTTPKSDHPEFSTQLFNQMSPNLSTPAPTNSLSIASLLEPRQFPEPRNFPEPRQYSDSRQFFNEGLPKSPFFSESSFSKLPDNSKFHSMVPKSPTALSPHIPLAQINLDDSVKRRQLEGSNASTNYFKNNENLPSILNEDRRRDMVRDNFQIANLANSLRSTNASRNQLATNNNEYEIMKVLGKLLESSSSSLKLSENTVSDLRRNLNDLQSRFDGQ